RYITAGQTALRTGSYAAAVKAYTEALRILPNDPDALTGLKLAQDGLELELKKQRDYQAAMTAANNALNRRAYADAGKELHEALRIFPLDATAAAALKDARFKLHMDEGQQAFNAKRYADAVRAYEKALAEQPDNLMAQAALNQAKLANKPMRQ